jgi:hypothetical protein
VFEFDLKMKKKKKKFVSSVSILVLVKKQIFMSYRKLVEKYQFLMQYEELDKNILKNNFSQQKKKRK